MCIRVYAYVCMYVHIYEKRTKNRDKSYKEKQDNKPNQIKLNMHLIQLKVSQTRL